jgi:hypothetical protein
LQIKLEEDVHGKDFVTVTEITRPLQIEETGNAAQADASDGLEFAHAHVASKASKTRQSRGHIHDDKTSEIETEARTVEDDEMSVADDPGIFQVIKISSLYIIILWSVSKMLTVGM